MLDVLGKTLMKEVRDRTIREFDLKMDGTMRDEDSRLFFEKYSRLDDKSKDFINKMVPEIVDLCLHNLLCVPEEYPEIVISINGKDVCDLSDGLAGELYTEDGWIAKFSTQGR